MSEIIKLVQAQSIKIWLIVVILTAGCHSDDTDSERDRVIGMLTGNSVKNWILEASNIDGQEIIPSSCDSSYVLVMKSDYKWEEVYLKLQCYQTSYGSWSLNDDNDVISIRFVNPGTGEYEEKHFEIEELSEEYFAYQIAENNRLKYVRLKWGEGE